MASPRLELGTFSVLDWRDNQLHHETICDIIYTILLFNHNT